MLKDISQPHMHNLHINGRNIYTSRGLILSTDHAIVPLSTQVSGFHCLHNLQPVN
ncbi:hypothetical protein BaRGS_00003949, partial [Batillaria attramentaria]